MDELSPDELCQFRATPSELRSADGKKTIRDRIENLYSQLLLDPDFGSMFRGESIEYDDEWVSYVVSELQGIGLLHDETNTDALGDAYEVFLPSTLKGESGQFFTPREVVRFAISVINPSFERKEIIFDPACGSGGFLITAIKHLRKQITQLYAARDFSEDRVRLILRDHAGKYVHGIDIEPLLFKIAKSYMAIIGDGRSNIYNFDSLEPFSKLPLAFISKIKPGGVDVVTTNPPFGTKIEDTRPYVLREFDLGHKLQNGEPTDELLAGQDPDKLFLERDFQFLKDPGNGLDGGRMVIVLPRQNLSGAEETSIQLRKWLLRKVKVFAVVDLPRETFQPHTGTKTSLVFLQKVENPEADYPIFMAVSEAVGHDRRGAPIYRKDLRGNYLRDEADRPVIWNDLPDILDNWRQYLRDARVSESSPSSFVVTSNQIRNDPSWRMDAWYWDPNKNELAKKLLDYADTEIKEVVNLRDLVVEHGIFYPGRHKRNYVRRSEHSLPFYSGTQVLQVRPFDLQYQPKDYAPAKNHIVEKNWLLVTRSGSTGRVVIVNDEMAGKMVTEHVIRIICDEDLIDPYYVYAYLATDKIGKMLMERGIYASVVDHLSPPFIATLPIPRLDPEKEKRIASAVRKAEEKRALASKMLEESSDEIQDIVFSALGIDAYDIDATEKMQPDDELAEQEGGELVTAGGKTSGSATEAKKNRINKQTQLEPNEDG